MKIILKGYITCKEAENYSDCADNYAYNKETNRFAVSDGVTKSFYPQIWSKILVDNYVVLKGTEELSIEGCQEEWLKQVTKIVDDLPETKWFVKNAFKMQESGLATFVSLRFDKDKWFAKALGDSFLFFIPKGKEKYFDDWTYLSSKYKYLSSKPTSKSKPVFDNFPDYYSSRGGACGDVESADGLLELGTFYLMTDALSEWIFEEKECALREIQEEWIDQQRFESSVKKLRKSQRLNNDDTTVLIIDIDEFENDGNVEYKYEPINVTDIKDLIDAKEKTEVKIKGTLITEISDSKNKLDYSEALSECGNTYSNNDNYDSTIYKPEILSHQTCTDLCNKGVAYIEKKSYDLAIKDFNDAINIKPDYHKAFYYRGVAYIKKENYDLAIKDLTNAIKLNPKDPDYFLYRGEAYIKKESYDLAIKDLTNAIKIEPDYAEAQDYLKKAYEAKRKCI